MTEYKILPPVIERGIYKHRLVERNGMVGFFETYLLRNPDILYGYCVARITREKEARFKNGKVIPARERFPSPSRFGTHRFFYQPKSAKFALEHYHELVQKFSTPYPPKKPRLYRSFCIGCRFGFGCISLWDERSWLAGYGARS